jgi:protein subunit release factor A
MIASREEQVSRVEIQSYRDGHEFDQWERDLRQILLDYARHKRWDVTEINVATESNSARFAFEVVGASAYARLR